MVRQQFDVVIVGAGHAGAQAAIALRQRKFLGSIALIGEEPELPYERPPLSKEYLAGDKPFERLLLRPTTFWSERDVAMLLGRRVVVVDAAAHEVTTSDGMAIGYGTLIWATGGTPRRINCAGHNLPGVHAVRSRADVDRMAAELPQVERVAVIGGGYIGLEAAAVLIKLGRAVTVFEAQDRVLARVAGEALSRFFETEHRARGVDVRLNARIGCIEERAGRACGVRLEDGDVVPADMVIVGIGIVPEVEPLVQAGAVGENGVKVDTACLTSLPDIFAIGDCAAHVNTFAAGATVRLESVQNANDMATIVADNLTGKEATYTSVPWFWSNQYDLKLQTVGLSIGHDDAVVRGDPSTRSFSVVYLRDGCVVAVDSVNAVKDYVQARKLVETAAVCDPVALADPKIPLKSLI